MLTFDPTQTALVCLVLLGLELALLWAAAALGDAPPLSFGKLLLIAVGVTSVWGAINVAIAQYSGIVPTPPFAPENRMTTAGVAVLGLGITWLVSAMLYVPLLPVSVPRSMRISLFQMLLRAFLYVLVFAVIMVVLALIQIYMGTEARGDLRAPLLPLLARS